MNKAVVQICALCWLFLLHIFRKYLRIERMRNIWGKFAEEVTESGMLRKISLHCMNFQKHDKKFHLIKYTQKHNKYYTKITLLTIFIILIKICICITYDTSWLLSTFTLYGHLSNVIQHVSWQPLSGANWSVSYLLHPSSREADPFP
jgi:hypothetical protein